MKNVFSLLLIIGLLVLGWTNREKLSGLVGKSSTIPQEEPEQAPEPVEVGLPPPVPNPSGTPHPAKEAKVKARALYPGLGIPNSALNKKFVTLYTNTQRADPALLTQPDWPLQLAEQSMIALGGVPLARNTPVPVTPKPLPGTAMDRKGGH